MKAKWLQLTWPQRVLLLLQAAMILLFVLLYNTIGRQQVIWYDGIPYRMSTDGEVTSYSGKIDGEAAVFTVSPGPVVEYRLGETLYGPYSIVFDDSAVPSKLDSSFYTGVEVRQGAELLFRGAYLAGNTFLLFREDGEIFSSITVSFTGSSGEAAAPSVRRVLQIAVEPEVVQRGTWFGFWTGVFLCIMCAVSILYADALFRFNLRFRIRNAADAEPSDWELASRWIAWISLPILALVLFILGLTHP